MLHWEIEKDLLPFGHDHKNSSLFNSVAGAKMKDRFAPKCDKNHQFASRYICFTILEDSAFEQKRQEKKLGKMKTIQLDTVSFQLLFRSYFQMVNFYSNDVPCFSTYFDVPPPTKTVNSNPLHFYFYSFLNHLQTENPHQSDSKWPSKIKYTEYIANS
jgi:hypothetical protein